MSGGKRKEMNENEYWCSEWIITIRQMDFLWQCQKIKRDGVSRGLWAGGGVCKTFLPNLNENLVNFHLAANFPLKNWDKCSLGAFKGALITSAISGPFFKAQLSGQRYTMTRKLWLEIFTYCKNAANPPEIFLCANFFYIVTFLFERNVRTVWLRVVAAQFLTRTHFC